MRFKATFRKYWCDYCQEYTEIYRDSVQEILEYAYAAHRDSVYPQHSKFYCTGKRKYGEGGSLEVSCSLLERMGYRGSLWLEKIVCFKDDEQVIVFEKGEYISPKTAEAFDDFAELVGKRKKTEYGEF